MLRPPIKGVSRTSGRVGPLPDEDGQGGLAAQLVLRRLSAVSSS